MAVTTWGDTAISSLENILGSAVSTADAAVGSASSGLNAVLGGQGVVSQAVQGMNANAQKMNQSAADVQKTAAETKAIYEKLTPVADLLGVQASDLWGEGDALTGRANSLFGIGDSLLNMDRSAGGLAGEYLKIYDLLSPDRYVAQAASDTQAAGDNARAQMERNLSRKGVSAGSGAYLAMQKQQATALLTALASMKTRARQTGITEQAAFLDKLTAAAKGMYDTANSTEQNALTAKNASLTATKGQADTIAAQGSGMKSVADMFATAGSLFGDAASVMGSAATLNTNYLNLLNDAWGDVASAQQKAASTRLDAANIELNANTSGGGVSRGGVNVTSAEESDPWAATGHTSTWWKNKLSTDDFQDMATNIAAMANG